MAVATEKLFLPPIRLALSPEITDLHMPAAGVAHNLAVVKIRKSYPGQGNKVINSLLGAGQMMFTKYLIVVSGEVDIRDYNSLAATIAANVTIPGDLVFMKGPLDVLDHSSDTFAFGGKLGVDATEKRAEERPVKPVAALRTPAVETGIADQLVSKGIISEFSRPYENLPVYFISVDQESGYYKRTELMQALEQEGLFDYGSYVFIVDHTIDTGDIFTAAWQVLGNSDPLRDHHLVAGSTLVIDGTMKVYREGGFSRRWPEVVCSDEKTIAAIDTKWESLNLGIPLISPSLKYSRLRKGNSGEVVI
jgi:4-hydroxy-3-polyprenylbenzoate decarboxylase